MESRGLKSALDVNEQQVDLCTTNSWLLRLRMSKHLSLPSALPLTRAPFIINSKLKKLLAASGGVPGRGSVTPKFVVNVSAMEGKFYRHNS